MSRSRMNTRARFLCAVAATTLVALTGNAFAETSISQTQEISTADMAAKLLVDATGAYIGKFDLSANGIEPDDAGNIILGVTTLTSVPAGVTMSPLAPKPTATPTKVSVSVKSSLPVAYCATSSIYNKRTGLCGDGKLPYKIVPLSHIADPAAKTPNIVCTKPNVPTFRAATLKFACIVPTGFKLSM